MPATRRATSMTLDAALLDEARALGVNVSRAAEEGILASGPQRERRRWKEENAEFIGTTTSGSPRTAFRTVTSAFTTL
jgi:antitoxin CcdA